MAISALSVIESIWIVRLSYYTEKTPIPSLLKYIIRIYRKHSPAKNSNTVGAEFKETDTDGSDKISHRENGEQWGNVVEFIDNCTFWVVFAMYLIIILVLCIAVPIFKEEKDFNNMSLC